MVTHVVIAITILAVFAVASFMSQQSALRIEPPQPNVLCVVVITQPTLKDVNLISTLKKMISEPFQKNCKQNFSFKSINRISTNPDYSQNCPSLPQNPSSHTQDHNSTQNHNTTAQLSSFINEFKALINSLISLLTTVIDKIIKNAN